MNYLTQRNLFLDCLGNPTGQERADAIEAFDKTVWAAMAQWQDAWSGFWFSVLR